MSHGRQGQSTVLIFTVLTAVVLAGLTAFVSVGNPIYERMQDSSAIDQATDMVSALSDSVSAVAEGGEGSQQRVSIRFGRGTVIVDADDDELAYELETGAELLSPGATQQIGQLRLSAMADVSVTRDRVDGQRCWRLQNDKVSACIRRLPDDPDDLIGADTVGYWRFHSGSGQVLVDNSSYGNNGTRGSTDGGDTDDPDWVGGKTSSALQFDGADTGSLPQSSSMASALDGDRLTIAFWIKPQPDTSSFDDILRWTVENGSGDTHTINTETMDDENDSIYTRFIAENSDCGDRTGDGGFWARNSDMGIDPGTWNHYAVTYNGSAVVEYANGHVQARSFDNCNVADLASDVRLISLPNGQTIDEIRIWNRTLPTERVSWEAAKDGYINYIDTSDLILEYTQRGSGATLNGSYRFQLRTRNRPAFTENGTGTTTPDLTGDNLGRGRIDVHVRSFHGLDYTLQFGLRSGSDFLSAELDRD